MKPSLGLLKLPPEGGGGCMKEGKKEKEKGNNSTNLELELFPIFRWTNEGIFKTGSS